MEENTNMPLPEEAGLPDPNERVAVCDVQFRVGSKIYYFDPDGIPVKAGEHVIIETSRGPEYGYCTAGEHRVTQREIVPPLRKVLRIATERDEEIKAENTKKEKEAFEFCLKKIGELGLEMQLVSTECAFDGSKLLFYFTADGRVDFRELVKILASNYHYQTRIELRQIGVRDKAKMVGGLGICGRPFCCSQFLADFLQPVSIKMAKTQSLSLNPGKISGTCGRLMCCLKFEQEAYEDLIKNSPKQESFVDTPDGRGTVTDVNLMAQSVKVRLEQEPDEIRCYRNCDICVLRNGRAKKNDPPIPEDLAPISGGRKSAPRLFEERVTTALDEPPEPQQTDVDPPAHSRRKPKDKPPVKDEPEKPAPEKKPETQKKAPRLEKKPPQPEKKPAQPEKKPPQQEKPTPRQKKPEQKSKEPKAQKPPKAQPEQAKPEQAKPEQAKPEQAKPKPRRKYYYHKQKKGK